MATQTSKTYRVASCARGCAYSSTSGGTCAMCHGPLTEPQAMTADQARALFMGGQRYDAGKVATVAWLAAQNREGK